MVTAREIATGVAEGVRAGNRDLINSIQSTFGNAAAPAAPPAGAATGSPAGSFNPSAAAAAGRAAGVGPTPASLSILRSATNAATAGLSNFGSVLSNLGPVGTVIETMLGDFSTLMSELGGHAGALGQAFSTGFGLIGQALSSVTNIGMAAINLVFAPMNALIGMAQAGGGDTGYRTQIELIRKSFGDLRQGIGGDVYGAVKTFRGELSETGLRVRRIFGNRGEVAQAVRETAESLGPTLSQLSGNFRQQAEGIATYRKVFDLSNESMQQLGARAIITGTTVEEQGRQIAQISLGLANKFGGSARQIGRDVGAMIADVKNFGGIAPQVLGQISAHMRQLGLSYEKLAGVVTGFDNFQDAAKNSATLAQQFGIQVDALQMMREQDPAARFETLRRAFYATGQSIESMTRQQKAALAASANLDVETVSLGFSVKNQGKSYADVQKQSEESQKKQLSQTEVMQELAHSIDRLVKSGQQMKGGFFEIFFDGFTKGIMRSAEFRQIMRELNIIMRIVFNTGREIGAAFVHFFPGVREIFGGLANIFNPASWRQMMGNIKDILIGFFMDLDVNPAEAATNLVSGFQTAIANFLGDTSGGFSTVIEGVKKFIKAIIYGGLGFLQAGVIELRKAFTENFSPNSSDATKIFNDISGMLSNIWNQIKGFLQDALGQGTVGSRMVRRIGTELAGLFKDVGGTLGALLKTTGFGDNLSKAFNDLIGGIFGPDAAGLASGGIIGFATNLGGQLMTGLNTAIQAYLKDNPDSPLALILYGTGAAGMLANFVGATPSTTKAATPPAPQPVTPTPPTAAELAVSASLPPPEAIPSEEEILGSASRMLTTEQLRKYSESFPTENELSLFRERIQVLNLFITENLSESLLNLRNSTENIKNISGGAGTELNDLIKNVAETFGYVKYLVTTITETKLNPSLIETQLSTMGVLFRTIQGHMSGPAGISSLIHDLKSYFVINRVEPKIVFIQGIFDKIKLGLDSMSSSFESLNAAISSIDVLVMTPTAFEGKLNQYKNIITGMITHFTTNQYGLTALSTASYNAHQIALKAASIIENMQTSNQLFASIGTGEGAASSVDPSQILAPALSAVSAMVLNVNEIDRTLREFANNPITIPASLNKLTHDILGGTTEYTVRPGNVQFNFHLEVSIDTKELKTALSKAGVTTAVN